MGVLAGALVCAGLAALTLPRGGGGGAPGRGRGAKFVGSLWGAQATPARGADSRFAVNLAKYDTFYDAQFGVTYSQAQAMIVSAGWSAQYRERLYDPVEKANTAYHYFLRKGAAVRSLLNVEQTKEDALRARDRMCQFLQDASSNVKLLYLAGHASKEGGFALGGGLDFTPLAFVECLRKGKATGLVTLIVDACYVSTWYQTIWEKKDTLEAGPRRAQANLHINLRLESQRPELARDGRWSERLFDNLEEQKPYGTDVAATPGWGTLRWLRRPPDDTDIPSAERLHGPQADISADIMYSPASNRWTNYQPGDRVRFV